MLGALAGTGRSPGCVQFAHMLRFCYCFGRRAASLIAESQMKPARICIALVVVLALCSFAGQATSQAQSPEIDAATQLFHVGKFAEAGKL
jgi:hypothetical protein